MQDENDMDLLGPPDLQANKIAMSIRQSSVSALISRNNTCHLLSPINEKDADENVERESLMDNSYEYNPDHMKNDYGGGDGRENKPTMRRAEQTHRLDVKQEELKEG